MKIFLRKHYPMGAYLLYVNGVRIEVTKSQYRLLSKFLSIKEF